MQMRLSRWLVVTMLGVSLACLPGQGATLRRKLKEVDTPSLTAGRDGLGTQTSTNALAGEAGTLKQALAQAAIRNEVLVCLGSRQMANEGGYLDLWLRSVRHAGVENALVLAMDQETLDLASARGVQAVLVKAADLAGVHNRPINQVVGSNKWNYLHDIARLGYSVFFSDADVIVIQNPFKFLSRDADVEAMSDGFDEADVKGNFHLGVKGGGWMAHGIFSLVSLNAGAFFLPAGKGSIELMQTVATRNVKEGIWDQQIFTEEVCRPGFRERAPRTVRVLDHTLFANSAIMFTDLRHNDSVLPVMVHLNAHGDKMPRLRAIFDKYVLGGDGAELAALAAVG